MPDIIIGPNVSMRRLQREDFAAVANVLTDFFTDLPISDSDEALEHWEPFLKGALAKNEAAMAAFDGMLYPYREGLNYKSSTVYVLNRTDEIIGFSQCLVTGTSLHIQLQGMAPGRRNQGHYQEISHVVNSWCFRDQDLQEVTFETTQDVADGFVNTNASPEIELISEKESTLESAEMVRMYKLTKENWETWIANNRRFDLPYRYVP